MKWEQSQRNKKFILYKCSSLKPCQQKLSFGIKFELSKTKVHQPFIMYIFTII